MYLQLLLTNLTQSARLMMVRYLQVLTHLTQSARLMMVRYLQEQIDLSARSVIR